MIITITEIISLKSKGFKRGHRIQYYLTIENEESEKPNPKFCTRIGNQ